MFFVDAVFEDRVEAGRQLGQRLKHLQGEAPVVVALPRGGVIVGDEIAKALDAPLDVIMPRKLGAPGNPELAIGAVTEAGECILNPEIVEVLAISPEYIEDERERQLAEIHRRVEVYRRVRPRVPLEGRTVILTDDGVATGATMKAAVTATKAENPKKLIVAVPVGPRDTMEELAETVEECICLHTPEFMGAVGQFYATFDQVSDDEVLQILKKYAEREMRFGR